MTSSSQTKPREPNSHVFRLIFYVLSLAFISLNCVLFILHSQLELSPGPAKYSLIFAPMMWCCLSVVTLPLCLDEFAKDRYLLPLMYAQFYVSIILLRHYGMLTMVSFGISTHIFYFHSRKTGGRHGWLSEEHQMDDYALPGY